MHDHHIRDLRVTILSAHLTDTPSPSFEWRTTTFVHTELGAVLLREILRDDLCRGLNNVFDIVLVGCVGWCDQDVVSVLAISGAGAWVQGDVVWVLHAYTIELA